MQLRASFSFFLILIFCQELCSEARNVPEKPLPSMCTQPMYAGECRAIFLRWFYNSKTNRCEWFRYGGCGSNENNFLTKSQCQKVCIDT